MRILNGNGFLVTLKFMVESQVQANERIVQDEPNSDSPAYRLLEAIAQVAHAVLTVDQFDVAINTALQLIGESLKTDRVNLIENVEHSLDRSLHWRVLCEWDSPGTVPQFTDPQTAQGSYREIPSLHSLLQQGQAISYRIEDAPEPFRSAQMAIGVRSTHLVPIFVEGQWWGILGLDDCQEAKHRSAAELSVLKLAADCVGSAIQRQRTQHALLQAEQDRVIELAEANDALLQRDRLLSTVAQITNYLLEESHVERAIARAFQAIGEAAGVSRVALLQETPEPGTGRMQHSVRVEWTAPGIPRQSDDPVTQTMYSDEYTVLVQELYAGRSTWSVVDELPEPMRSQQERIWVKSTGAIPIFIAGCYFGAVAFDDCVAPRQWTDQEIDVLTTAAGAIGAALHRQQLVDRLIEERTQAAQERATELAKANQALKRSLDVLAADPELNRFIGHVLGVIAQQFEAPITEYWYHPTGDVAYIGLMSYQERALGRDEIAQHFPTHPGLSGFHVPPELRDGMPLQWRKTYLVYDDHRTHPHTKHCDWIHSVGLFKELNVPMILGDVTIGALIVRLPCDRPITLQQIELAQALAHQATLAVELTRLADEAKQAAILDERNRLARDIHDTLAQAFAGIGMQLQAAHRLRPVDPEKADRHCDRALTLAQSGLTEARQSVWTLSGEGQGYRDLVTGVMSIVKQLATETTTTLQTDVQGTPYTVDADIGLNLLRIVQEALTNAVRHAHAQRVHVQLGYSAAAIQLVVRDDGCGFNPQLAVKGFGLASMQQRADHIGAQLQVSSQPDTGTTILLRWPIKS